MDGPELILPAYTPPRGPIRIDLARNRMEPVDGRLFSGTAAVTADQAYLSWFRVDQSMTFTAMEYLVGTAAGNVDLGIFSTTDFATFTLLGHTGATAAAGSSAIQSINLLASVTCDPAIDYFAAIVGSSGSLTLGRMTTLQGLVTTGARAAYIKASLDPLATFTTGTASNLLPWLCCK